MAKNIKSEKNNPPAINQEYIMSIVASSDTNEGTKSSIEPNNKEAEDKDTSEMETVTSANNNQETREHRKKKNRTVAINYETQFIKRSELTVRSGKGVYIRADYHNNINRIISIIGDSGISITDYLDNVLAYHFECFEQDITEIFNQKYKPIIK